ncbi:M28 family peptidase [Neolewinella lacunae]|uniref:M28 family peptidase n=1 Tax=Neolewinella lacunae TaxID=1517758 RepID=A0A923PNQ7_9BACT|nr:M28 family peptidase [Neolewinella lacunae]MBC6996824.1 M28 family peptidase [Neolewinella lacunae]MDN3633802.1 M28 family peptidase [Neolewinella lacunae]
MLRYSFLFVVLAFTASVFGQYAPQQLFTTDDEARALAATITVEDLTRHLTILSADDMEGRETGEPGQKRAAEYLRGEFARLGLPTIGENNGYFQRILFTRQMWQHIDLQLDGESLRHLWEFASAPSQNAGRSAVDIGELTFLGYGIKDAAYDDYAGQDLRGKHIIILSGEPQDAAGNYRLSGNSSPSEWSATDQRKLSVAHEAGVATVFIIDANFKDNVRAIRQETLDGRMKMAETTEAERQAANVVYLTPQLSKKIMGRAAKKVVKARKKLEKSGKLKPVTFPVALRLTQEKSVEELVGENVLGFVEGTDPRLKDEVLVVSAHYDHIGRRGDVIFNGADDNGSGTSTVLEIAEAFVKAKEMGKGARRSVLFLLVSGEEKGLLGSEYYANHPIFPLENTIADINVDMVGRVDEAHEDNPNYIYVIGSDRLSSELHAIGERMNSTFTQLELDYTYNAEDDPNRYYYRSDHYNFAEKGIPSVFFFNGTHADYHQSTDTIEKINFKKMALVGQLIFHNAWQLANQDRRIVVDVK